MSNPLNELLMQPTPLGENFIAGRGLRGPAIYATGGVTIAANYFALLTLRGFLGENLTQDGLYFVRFILPEGGGFPTAQAVWFVAATGLQVANGTNLSASSVKVFAIGN